MTKTLLITTVCSLLVSVLASMNRFPNVPETEITNGLVRAQIYLPDPENGYYRGTRFDWSGVIPRLDYQGHTFHAQWFETYAPTNHDAIMGPVEEFGPLGYGEAKAGESFVKIGIGVLRKSDEKPYSSFNSYELLNTGNWRVKKKANQIQFRHTLNDPMYGYDYQKTVTLTPGKPELVIKHTLKNKGSRAFETTAYNHNFFVIDQQPTGPGYAVTMPSNNLSQEGGKGLGTLVKLDENQVVFLRDFVKGESTYFPNLTAGKPVAYAIEVANVKTGATVNIMGDQPIEKLVFWSSATTVCPEPYIRIKVEPRKSISWTITYTYSVKAPVNK